MQELALNLLSQLLESQVGLVLVTVIVLNFLPNRYSRTITELWSWLKAFVKTVRERRKEIKQFKDEIDGDKPKEDKDDA